MHEAHERRGLARVDERGEEHGRTVGAGLAAGTPARGEAPDFDGPALPRRADALGGCEPLRIRGDETAHLLGHLGHPAAPTRAARTRGDAHARE
jgi:hypothetical protein